MNAYGLHFTSRRYQRERRSRRRSAASLPGSWGGPAATATPLAGAAAPSSTEEGAAAENSLAIAGHWSRALSIAL
ncbi:hypothetical protein ACRWOO_29720, partial [Streptomyces sp. NEAU-PBA10]|uniref:hypothetical protein n=1 Tax=Streptomyces sp. NEAU-PBA10 TaxID=3438640 RepID=UPI003F7993C2